MNIVRRASSLALIIGPTERLVLYLYIDCLAHYNTQSDFQTKKYLTHNSQTHTMYSSKMWQEHCFVSEVTNLAEAQHVLTDNSFYCPSSIHQLQ